MSFIPPALLMLFALTFFGIWWWDQRLRHLLLFALSFGAVALAILAQITVVPSDAGLNTLISAALYMGGVLLFGEAVLQRSGRRMPWRVHIGALLAVLAALAYFFYADRNLLARVYILNFSMGLALLYAAWRARFLCRGGSADAALFWLVLLVALHFFPRTLLMAGTVEGLSDVDFAAGVFWRWVLISLSMLGAAAGLGVLIIVGIDVMATLRWERDSDSLTGLLNRRGLQTGTAIRTHGRRNTDSIAVVLGDIDNFKSINDRFGHRAGDIVLVAFARLLRRMARSSDLVARLGGEEFVIVMHDYTGEQGKVVAERLRQTIETTSFEGLPADWQVTCSFGVTELRPDDDLWSAIERADRYLYTAKRQGRNRTVSDEIPDMTRIP